MYSPKSVASQSAVAKFRKEQTGDYSRDIAQRATNSASALLLVAYNRPDLVAGTLPLLRSLHEGPVYLACDGPNLEKPGDTEQVMQVQRLMESFSAAGAKHLLFQSKNLGPRDGVLAAIDWFFEHESEGVIVEDDALPSGDFLNLATEFLEFHRDNKRVWGLGGFNPTGISLGDSTYGFIRFAMMAGAWASWSDRWFSHDRSLHRYSEARAQGMKLWPSRHLFHGLDWHLKSALRRPVSFWDYQLSWSVAASGGVWAITNANLAVNRGFRADATHGKKDPWPAARLESISGVSHPDGLSVDVTAERLFLQRHLRVLRPLWLNYLRNGVRALKAKISR